MWLNKINVHLFLAFLFTTAWGDDMPSYLQPRFSYYTNLLLNTASQPYSSDMFSNCTFYDVCLSDDMDDVVLTNKSDFFPHGFWVNTSLVGTKLVSGVVASDDISNICFGTSQEAVWEGNLKNDIYDAATWQYIGFDNEGSFLYHPISNYTAGCPGLYDPRKRPWYLSAITGPIDLVIMIDVSTGQNSADRLTAAKNSALRLLRTVSYWAFINVCLYSSNTKCMSEQLVRCTSDNIQAANNFISNIVKGNSEYVGVNNALDETLTMIQSSADEGSSSNCHAVIVFLASDHNDFTFDSIDSIVTHHSAIESTVLSYVFDLDNDNIFDRVFKDMSCVTDGIYKVFTSTSESVAEEILNSFTSFFGSAVTYTDVIYSEIYEDNLGLGDILTGVLPLYEDIETDYNSSVRQIAGVYGLDLQISSLNNNGEFSNDEIMAYLASSLTCANVNPSEDALAYLREGEICYDTEAANYGSKDELPLERNKMTYRLIAGFGFVASLFMLILSLFFFYNVPFDEKIGVGVVIIIIYLAFGISLIVYVIDNNWKTTVIVTDWSTTRMNVLETTIDPAVCCKKYNCQCLEYYESNTCTENKQELVEGPCGDGYQCCREVCYDCNCHSCGSDDDTCCDTCCECESDVINEQCETKCDKCYNGLVVWSYFPHESRTNEEVVLDYIKKCGYGKPENCAQSFIDKYPVGSKHEIYYNPNNWLETLSKDEGDYNGDFFPVVISLTVFMCVPFLLIGLEAWRNYILKPDTDPKYSAGASPYSSTAAELEQDSMPASVVPPPAPSPVYAHPPQGQHVQVYYASQQQVYQPVSGESQQPYYEEEEPPAVEMTYPSTTLGNQHDKY